MKQKHRLAVGVSAPKLITLLLTICAFGAVGAHELYFSSAASKNDPPTGSFTGLKCTYDSSRKDYLYTISAKWADKDAVSSNANAYITNKNGNGNTSSKLTSKTENGPTNTWTVWKAALPDSAWPVKLYVHDVGNATSETWLLKDTANKPACPAIPTPAPTKPTPAPVKPTPKPTPTPVTTPTKPAPSTSSDDEDDDSGSGNDTSDDASDGSTGNSNSGGLSDSADSGSDAIVDEAATSDLSAETGATATTGTTSVVLKINANGASRVHVTYTADDGSQPIDSEDVTVSGDSADITLNNLNPKAAYTYTVTRTDAAGTPSVSPTDEFTTAGYSITMTFKDAKGKPVKGIAASIDDDDGTKATSDASGRIHFKDLPSGEYAVKYTYKGKQYTKSFETSAATGKDLNDDGTPAILSLDSAINVAKLSGAKGSNAGAVITLVIFGLLGVGALVWFLLRRRKQQQLMSEYASLSAPAMSSGGMPAPQPAPAAVTQSGTLPSHAGESLRDMVLDSMRQQAAQPSAQQPQPTQPQPPIVATDPLPYPAAPAAPQPQPIALPSEQLQPAPQQPSAPMQQPTGVARPTPTADDQALYIPHDKQ